MQDKEAAFNKIASLVERFSEQLPSYKSVEYNETLTRRDFIDPFFKALGWDIDNEQGYAEAYREVIHEDKVRIGSSTKAPDYSFRLPGGKRLFFVEAKKPSVLLKDEIVPAYQVRRYGWSAKLPISIITDFEEFAVYDCTLKPFPNDKASVSRVKYLTFNEYLKEFDFIWDTFSKEKVLKGSFDRFVAGTANKKGTAAVDDDFLQSLDKWRNLLATAISKQNKEIDEDELNYAVQATIDRLIFLRIAEDRSIEPYGNLAFAVRQGDYFRNLYSIFKDADEKYNSGLFDLKKDNISADLLIDNKTVKTIVDQLYYPECPYEFSVLSVEILGSAYEQFLGKQIRINKSHKAVIEEKPEVRKAGGVYYTPQYIVEYIVKNTVGKLVEGKTPEEVSALKILDPACGSGSFLIGAYQYLLDWHKTYYQAKSITSKGGKQSPVTPDGNLTTAEKKRILLNNIFGVDLDVNAVEVTKLSLLLKCLEGETEASIKNQLSLFNERVLPTLDDNIKSGNSLIDLDFYDAQIEFEQERKVKPFNWQKAFPKIFGSTNPGFDAVIGNPPYVKLQTIIENNPRETADYFKTRFRSASKGNYDLYVVFTEKAYSLLNGNGELGYILPHKFLQSDFGEGLRDFITEQKALRKIIHFGAEQIFKNATTYTCLLFLSKSGNNSMEYTEVEKPDEWAIEPEKFSTFEIELPSPGEKWNFKTGLNAGLFAKLNSLPVTLENITRKIFVGLQTSADKVYVLDIISETENTFLCYSKSLEKEVELEKGMVKLFLMGKDVKRYQQPKPRCVVIFPYRVIDDSAVLMQKDYIKKTYPLTWEYLYENKKVLSDREGGRFKATWWQYGRTQNLAEFDTAKIMTPYLAIGPNFTYDQECLHHTTKVFSLVFNEILKNSPLYILGLLNSKLLDFHIKSTGTVFRGGYFTFNTQFISNFRIKQLDLLIDEERIIHDEIVEFVKKILVYKNDLNQTRLNTHSDEIRSRITYFEEKLDHMFFKIYGLDYDEVKIVDPEFRLSEEEYAKD